MLVAGPGVLGEGPCCLPIRKRGKTPMLDAYRALIRDTCLQSHIQYIDIREMFLHAIPRWWCCFKGFVTKDGEHQNERGTIIVANTFSHLLKEHFCCRNAVDV